MTNAEYERIYREALFRLRQRGYAVGEPFRLKGSRYVKVRGWTCDDKVVLGLVWGGRRASRLVRMWNWSKRSA